MIPVDAQLRGQRPRRRPAVLLLGGSLGTTLAMWEPQVPELSRHAPGDPLRPPRPRRLAGARRARTRSPTSARDVLAMMDRLDLERVSYCGLSIGGMVGQWLADQRARADRPADPDLHRRRTCRRRRRWHERAAAVRAAGTPEVVADAVVGRWFTAGLRRSASRDRGALPGDDRRDTDAEGYAGCCEAIAGMDLRGGLPGITRADARDRRAPGSVDPARARRGDRRRGPGRALRAARPRRAPGQRRARRRRQRR